MRSFFSAGVSVSWMEGTGCFGDVLMCSPSTWAKAGSASAIARPVAAIAQPFENSRLDTFMNFLLAYKYFQTNMASDRPPVKSAGAYAYSESTLRRLAVSSVAECSNAANSGTWRLVTRTTGKRLHPVIRTWRRLSVVLNAALKAP
jgi:hypothetical protein